SRSGSPGKAGPSVSPTGSPSTRGRSGSPAGPLSKPRPSARPTGAPSRAGSSAPPTGLPSTRGWSVPRTGCPSREGPSVRFNGSPSNPRCPVPYTGSQRTAPGSAPSTVTSGSASGRPFVITAARSAPLIPNTCLSATALARAASGDSTPSLVAGAFPSATPLEGETENTGSLTGVPNGVAPSEPGRTAGSGATLCAEASASQSEQNTQASDRNEERRIIGMRLGIVSP